MTKRMQASPAPKSCQLDRKAIDLWFFSLKGSKADVRYLLSPDELLRADRFYFERHQRRFILARATLRQILGRYLDCPPASIEFSYHKKGKPYIQTPSKLSFNISHSGDWALIGVGCQHPIGVDIEQYSARTYLGIAEHAFSAIEITALKQSPDYLKPWLFFRIWSAKEAFIKISGLGLSYPTTSFSVIEDGKDIEKIYDIHEKQIWSMRPFMPRLAMSAAVCHHPAIQKINYYPLTHSHSLLDL